MLDRNNPKPLYAQLEDILRFSINNGDWEQNQLIPSENELSKTYNLSRTTVRSVITNLVNEGHLYRVQGKGTFVSPPKITTTSPAYSGVREQLESQGYKTRTKLVDFRLIDVPSKITKILNLQYAEKVLYIQRIRYIEDLPISIHRSYVPQSLCPTLNEEKLETEQLCVILESEFGLKTAHMHETLESVSSTVEEASFLKIEKGYPLLLLEEINTTKDGRVFEYTKISFRGDKIKLKFDYVNET